MTVSLTLAGVGIAILILFANLRTWWKGSKDPKALMPYAVGAAVGSLATVCVGGALGWGSSGIANMLSGAGDKGVSAVAGTDGAPVTTGSMGTLGPEGGVVVCILLGVGVLMFKASGSTDRKRMFGGFVSFAILALLPGVASALEWWPDVVNWAGTQGAGLIGSGTDLL